MEVMVFIFMKIDITMWFLIVFMFIQMKEMVYTLVALITQLSLILQILLLKVMEAQSFILAMLLLIQIFNFMLIITRFVIPLIIIELTANL